MIIKRDSATNVRENDCLDAVRILLICSADLSVSMCGWLPSVSDRPHFRSNVVRKCVDWESPETWVSGRKTSSDAVLLRLQGRRSSTPVR
jgi:hypothetical protein